jgi:hypothetical protein
MYFNVKRRMYSWVVSTTCKFMNPGSMHAAMQENVTVEIKMTMEQ